MADTKISALSAVTPADGDYVAGVDISDTTQSAQGSTKHFLFSAIVTYLTTALASIFASAAQGTTADSAVQPGDIGTAAAHDVAYFQLALTTDNAQTGTTYTLALTDTAGPVTMNNAASNVATIPANASVAFPVGSAIVVQQIGAGVTTITAAAGVTLNGVSAGSGALSAKWAAVSIRKTATNTWIAAGGIGTVA